MEIRPRGMDRGKEMARMWSLWRTERVDRKQVVLDMMFEQAWGLWMLVRKNGPADRGCRCAKALR